MFHVQVGFGKGQPTTTVWLGNVPSSFTMQQLQRHFGRFGRVRSEALDKYRAQCMVTFDVVDDASYALSDVKARGIFNRRVKVRKNHIPGPHNPFRHSWLKTGKSMSIITSSLLLVLQSYESDIIILSKITENLNSQELSNGDGRLF